MTTITFAFAANANRAQEAPRLPRKPLAINTVFLRHFYTPSDTPPKTLAALENTEFPRKSTVSHLRPTMVSIPFLATIFRNKKPLPLKSRKPLWYNTFREVGVFRILRESKKSSQDFRNEKFVSV